MIEFHWTEGCGVCFQDLLPLESSLTQMRDSGLATQKLVFWCVCVCVCVCACVLNRRCAILYSQDQGCFCIHIARGSYIHHFCYNIVLPFPLCLPDRVWSTDCEFMWKIACYQMYMKVFPDIFSVIFARIYYMRVLPMFHSIGTRLWSHRVECRLCIKQNYAPSATHGLWGSMCSGRKMNLPLQLRKKLCISVTQGFVGI